MTTTVSVAHGRRCDVTDCPHEMVIRIAGEQRCLIHAIERANEARVGLGLAPLAIDDPFWMMAV